MKKMEQKRPRGYWKNLENVNAEMHRLANGQSGRPKGIVPKAYTPNGDLAAQNIALALGKYHRQLTYVELAHKLGYLTEAEVGQSRQIKAKPKK